MKKISPILPFILIISMFPSFSVSAATEKENETSYNVQLETLSDDPCAAELNSYRDELLDYFNKKIKSHNEAIGDNSCSYLTAEDLDFTDDTKIHGLKYRGTYTEFEYNADYEDFLNSVNGEWWYIVLKKNVPCIRLLPIIQMCRLI